MTQTAEELLAVVLQQRSSEIEHIMKLIPNMEVTTEETSVLEIIENILAVDINLISLCFRHLSKTGSASQ